VARVRMRYLRQRCPMIVYTGGTFDLFHAGHVYLLSQCRKLAGEGGSVVVSLNTCAFVAAYKGKSPVNMYEERESVLLACRHVDQVVRNAFGQDSKPTIEAVRPDVIAIGIDWAQKDYYAQMEFDQRWLDDRNISLVYLPHPRPISTSEIKNRILETT
jgi:cytidyltransferase-like protein